MFDGARRKSALVSTVSPRFLVSKLIITAVADPAHIYWSINVLTLVFIDFRFPPCRFYDVRTFDNAQFAQHPSAS